MSDQSPTAYTAEQFRSTLESYANLAWEPGTPGAIATEALRIAAAVMDDDLLYAAYEEGSGRIGRTHILWAIRAHLMGDAGHG